MTKKVKIAVIGTGWWATAAHIPSLLANPRAQAILVDKNPGALQAASKKYGIKPTYSSLDAALKEHPDLKGAIVAVPHQAHYELGKEVLEKGLHLLMEKPMVLYALVLAKVDHEEAGWFAIVDARFWNERRECL